MIKSIEDLLTIPEVAEHCRVGERTVRCWIAQPGGLRAIRIGRLVRIRESDLRHFLRQRSR
ncbi:helix-turn-helix domain-containing protein [Caenispirillum salinarum]|uniref:helix-turn-helix domain-containing protein n=1 Tax=Caenispirillum salinarum TaxID=859058 RepID=UPI0005BCDDAA